MIARPTVPQLLHGLRSELRDVVAPAVTDPVASGSLEMVEALLTSLITRCEHETAWMREETAGVETLAEDLLRAGLDENHGVAGALNALRAADRSSDHLSDVVAVYDLAGELLSRCVEIALPAGGEHSTAALGALEARLGHEVAIRGDFSLAGRT